MSQPSGWNRVPFCICPLSLCDRRPRRPTGSGRPWSEPQVAVRRTHATSCDYPQPRISGELDGFCGMRTGLEPTFACPQRLPRPRSSPFARRCAGGPGVMDLLWFPAREHALRTFSRHPSVSSFDWGDTQRVARRPAADTVRKHCFWPVPSYGLREAMLRTSARNRWKSLGSIATEPRGSQATAKTAASTATMGIMVSGRAVPTTREHREGSSPGGDRG